MTVKICGAHVSCVKYGNHVANIWHFLYEIRVLHSMLGWIEAC